jgi:nicotinate-nucleotide adenylyltransferase
MNIAIFGGRFDPPHMGHLLAVKQVLEFRKDIDKVLLVPASKHQWKPIVASAKDRIAMLKFFLGPQIEISDTEIKRRGISYSVDTIKAIKQQSGAKIFWIVGSDIVPEFKKWKKSDDLLNLATFLIVPRDPHALPKTIPDGFQIISSPKLVSTDYSSTLIRERISQGKSISGLVPKEVEMYIKKHKLYV